MGRCPERRKLNAGFQVAVVRQSLRTVPSGSCRPPARAEYGCRPSAVSSPCSGPLSRRNRKLSPGTGSRTGRGGAADSVLPVRRAGAAAFPPRGDRPPVRNRAGQVAVRAASGSGTPLGGARPYRGANAGRGAAGRARGAPRPCPNGPVRAHSRCPIGPVWCPCCRLGQGLCRALETGIRGLRINAWLVSFQLAQKCPTLG